MFIIVKIPSLKELSKSILEIVNNIVIENSEIIKIIIVKKYLLISDLFVLFSKNENLFEYIWFGFVCERRLFKENLIKFKTLINLRPELVEKKDPPIITKIKKINDKLFDISLNEIPILETLLVIETSIFKKLLSKLNKTKTIEIIKIK